MLPIEGLEEIPSGETSTVPVGAASGAARSCDSALLPVGAAAGVRCASAGVAMRTTEIATAANGRNSFINGPLSTRSNAALLSIAANGAKVIQWWPNFGARD